MKAGRKPGVYLTWAEAQPQVQGYSGAIYKSFKSTVSQEHAVTLAIAYLEGEAGGQGEESVPQRGYVAWVDGSFRGGRYSGSVVMTLDGEILAVMAKVGPADDAGALRNIAGEMLGAVEAVRWAERHGVRELTIVHDYIGLRCWALGEWKAKTDQTLRYAAFMKERPWVRFVHVRGHKGIALNEEADRLAAAAFDAPDGVVEQGWS